MKAWQSVLLGFLLALLLAFAIGTARYGWRHALLQTQAALGYKPAQHAADWVEHMQYVCGDEFLQTDSPCYEGFMRMPDYF